MRATSDRITSFTGTGRYAASGFGRAAWAFSLAAAFLVFGAPTFTAGHAAEGNNAPANGSEALSWKPYSETDKMTDVTTHKVVSAGIFDDNIKLEASASCDKVGVEFAFHTFLNHQPSPFAWRQGQIGLRVRIDGGAVRTAQAKNEYGNEAKILFYDPAATEKAFRGALPHGQGKSPLLGPVNDMMSESLLAAVETAAAGKLNELAAARSIRVELPLANGNAYVIDLNPQDQALSDIIRQCSSGLHADVESSRKAEREAQARAEQQRVAKLNEQRSQSQAATKKRMCPAMQEMVVYLKTTIRSIEEYSPGGPNAKVTVTDAPSGTRVLVGDDEILGLPKGTLPHDRCLVSYDTPNGRKMGTVGYMFLASPENYSAMHRSAGNPPARSNASGCPPFTRPDLLGRC